jgi:hypothetical protein
MAAKKKSSSGMTYTVKSSSGETRTGKTTPITREQFMGSGKAPKNTATSGTGKVLKKATPRKATGGAPTATTGNKTVNSKVNRKIY